MASVITVMNMKGGVGKSTVAAHLAGALAVYQFGGKRRKVLAIDYDAQFNLSQMYISRDTYVKLEEARKTSLSILQDNELVLNPYELQVPGNLNPPEPDALAHKQYAFPVGGLDIIPSTLDLMYVALGQTMARTAPLEERFRKFIAASKKIYDVIVIDCHPAGSILTKTALQNSDHVVIPVAPSPFAARGVSLMMRFLEANRIGPSGASPHILFNLEGAQASLSQIDIRGNAHFSKYCLASVLRESTFFARPVGGEEFVWWSGRPHHRRAASRLYAVVDEIVTRTGC